MKTKKIPFDLERWQNGDFVIVQTGDGQEIEQLHLFDVDENYVLYAVVDKSILSYTEKGRYYVDDEDERDLFLVIEDKEEEQDEYVWKYVIKSDVDDKIIVHYYLEEKQDFFIDNLIKKEKVKISEL